MQIQQVYSISHNKTEQLNMYHYVVKIVEEKVAPITEQYAIYALQLTIPLST